MKWTQFSGSFSFLRHWVLFRTGSFSGFPLEVVRGNVRDLESGGRLFFFSGKEYCQLKNKKRIAEKWKTTFLSR